MTEQHADIPFLAYGPPIPTPPAGFVDRARLRRLLDRATTCPVTLMAAPAGWGKTTLLSSWVRAAGRPTVWLSAEPGEDRLWEYLVRALHHTTAGSHNGPPDRPPAPAAPERDRELLDQIAGRLARLPEPLLVVLDDLQHLGDRRVLDAVAYLLRHARSGLRAVIATRAEPALPWHRWRLSGELAELRSGELAFTVDEAAELAERHGLRLPDTQLAGLVRRTEGWPAGLRLAALAMQRDPSVTTISGEDPQVADYLWAEVLAGLPPDVVDTMVGCSALTWMSGELVDAVTGRDDGERMLVALARGNGFVVPANTGPPRYRYHRMFGELLRAELRRRGDGPECHRRAARWLADHGPAADALVHALWAGDWRQAGELVTSRWPELAQAYHPGETALPPPPPEPAVRENPEFGLAYAAACAEAGQPAAADAHLRDAERYAHRPVGPDRFAAVVAALRVSGARQGGDPAPLRAAATRLRELVEPGGPEGARALAAAGLGLAALDTGELERAEAMLGGGLAGAQRAGLSCLGATCLSGLALTRALRGRLNHAERTARAALAAPPCPGQAPAAHTGPAHLAAAVVHLERDHPAEAGPHLEAAHQLCEPAGQPVLVTRLAEVRSRLRLRQGDLRAAHSELVAARQALEAGPVPPEATLRLAAAEAEVCVARGDTAAVRRILEPLLPAAGPGRAELCVALARAYLRDRDPERAGALLPAWEEDSGVPLGVRVDAGVLAALAASGSGDRRRSRSALERALGLAEPEGFRLAFLAPGAHELLVDHLDSGTAHWPLLDDLVAAGGPAQPPPPATGPLAPLTDRELTVLRYLQGILSTAEIASELHVSVNTVKTHLRNLYRKLDTTRRREAVRRARELRLL